MLRQPYLLLLLRIEVFTTTIPTISHPTMIVLNLNDKIIILDNNLVNNLIILDRIKTLRIGLL